MNIEQLANTAHESVRAFVRTQGHIDVEPWHGMIHDDRMTVKGDVMYYLTNPEATPAEKHDAWVAAQEAAGWKHGPLKNHVDKIDPALVPYVGLSTVRKMSDTLFVAVINSLKPFLEDGAIPTPEPVEVEGGAAEETQAPDTTAKTGEASKEAGETKTPDTTVKTDTTGKAGTAAKTEEAKK